MWETTNEIRRKEGVLERQMKGRRPVRSSSIVMIGAVVLVLGVLVGGILGHFSAPQVVSKSGAEHLYLAVAYDPYSLLDKYFPANFSVPANVPVTITITNYDNGTNTIPAGFDQVQGTIGGTESVTNATASDVDVASVPADHVTHTFTIVSPGGNINVPIPAAQDTTPTVVTFTVVFPTAGPYQWHCMAYCDDPAMKTPGYMTGFITVTG